MIQNPFARAVRYRDGLPVAPGAFPGLGHSAALYTDALEFYRRGRDELGPLFWVHLGFGNWVVMCVDREGFELLRSKSGGVAHLKRDAALLLGESMLGQDGVIHQRMRAAMSGPFSPRGLGATGLMTTIAEAMSARVAGWIESRSTIVLADTQAVIIEILLRLLGVEVKDFAAWTRHHHDFGASVYPFFPSWIPGSPMWRAARARAWIDAYLLEVVREERRRPNRGTFISELAHGTDDEGKPLDERLLVDNLRLLTHAGYVTTAGVLAWMSIVLAQKPDLWRALCEEASAADALPTSPQEVHAHPVAEALFRETLRFYPSGPFAGRQLYEPVTLCGFSLPAGTVVYVSTCLFGRDPDLYPNPERFDVSRWLGRREPPAPIELSQFGGGAHFCLGYHLAWVESVLFALVLARQMSRAGLRPRLADGPAPVHHYLPSGHPTPSTRIEFVR